MDVSDFRASNSPRPSDTGTTYLITTATAERQPLFDNWWAGRACVREMKHLHQFGIVTSLCWVVMPDHLHWLLTLHHSPLNYVIRRFKIRSAVMVNRVRQRRGPVWQPGFLAQVVPPDEDWSEVGRYLVENPVRRHLSDSIENYPLWDAAWSAQDLWGRRSD